MDVYIPTEEGTDKKPPRIKPSRQKTPGQKPS